MAGFVVPTAEHKLMKITYPVIRGLGTVDNLHCILRLILDD